MSEHVLDPESMWLSIDVWVEDTKLGTIKHVDGTGKYGFQPHTGSDDDL